MYSFGVIECDVQRELLVELGYSRTKTDQPTGGDLRHLLIYKAQDERILCQVGYVCVVKRGIFLGVARMFFFFFLSGSADRNSHVTADLTSRSPTHPSLRSASRKVPYRLRTFALDSILRRPKFKVAYNNPAIPELSLGSPTIFLFYFLP